MDNFESILSAQLNKAIDIGNETSRTGFAMCHSTADKIRQIEEILYYTRRFIEERISNFNTLSPANNTVKLVSLGEACMARTLATRWGLKASKKFGEKTHPFDLSVHPSSCIPTLFANNFCNYLDLNDLVLQPDKVQIFNKRYLISFNHDFRRYNTEELLPDFVSAQLMRVENLKIDLRASDHVVFLIYREISQPEVFKKALINLKLSIESMQEVKKYTIIAANSGPEITSEEFRVIRSSVELTQSDLTSSGTIILANLKLPFVGYTFFNPAHLFSAQGFNYEKTIADIIKKVISAKLALAHGLEAG
jgi:hypothetical protein